MYLVSVTLFLSHARKDTYNLSIQGQTTHYTYLWSDTSVGGQILQTEVFDERLLIRHRSFTVFISLTNPSRSDANVLESKYVFSNSHAISSV